MNEVKSTIICLQEICENFQVFHYQKRKKQLVREWFVKKILINTLPMKPRKNTKKQKVFVYHDYNTLDITT